MSTPSAPLAKASKMNCGSTRPEHIRRITRAFAAYFRRETPARSAAVYVHQLQKKAAILGCQVVGGEETVEEFVLSISSSDFEFVSDFDFRISDLCPRHASTPAISLKICSSSNRCCLIEPEGQEATQVP